MQLTETCFLQSACQSCDVCLEVVQLILQSILEMAPWLTFQINCDVIIRGAGFDAVLHRLVYEVMAYNNSLFIVGC